MKMKILWKSNLDCSSIYISKQRVEKVLIKYLLSKFLYYLNLLCTRRLVWNWLDGIITCQSYKIMGKAFLELRCRWIASEFGLRSKVRKVPRDASTFSMWSCIPPFQISASTIKDILLETRCTYTRSSLA